QTCRKLEFNGFLLSFLELGDDYSLLSEMLVKTLNNLVSSVGKIGHPFELTHNITYFRWEDA
ncbi:MAG: hypothetical protein AAF892_12375, partial [Cyanobacteria bacterium P01_D01_bin.71]